MSTQEHDDEPIRDRDQLLELFRSACKPRAAFRIGTEAEKFGVLVESGAPVPYDGPRSIRRILEALEDRHGWHGEPEVDGGPVIALRRGEASITLEPGGQLELSGAPLESVHLTSTEVHGHLAELAEPSADLGIAWLGLGFHPFARREDFEWVPKLRYGVMREYLPARGSMALDMMLRTCTVQANLDYENEADAVRKIRVATAASPIVTAMFANSPLSEGKATGDLSHRARVWLDVDPDRTGLPDFIFSEGFGFESWAQWALDVPMFLLKRSGRIVRNTGQTFRSFMADGYGGHRATMADWETHINTLFPEVRLKRTIEVRGADSVPTGMLCALPALWKGLLYSPSSLAAAEQLLAPLTPQEINRSRSDIARRALDAQLGGRRVHEWACAILDLANQGLHSLGCLGRDGRDESMHLRQLCKLVEAGKCPAQELLSRWRPDAPSPVAQLIELARY